MHPLEAHDLHKRYGETHALAGFDLSVEAGTIHALLGPNGAGKTTAVRTFATLTRCDSGEVRVAGHDVRREATAVRRAIGLVGQHTALDEVLLGRENLVMLGRLHGLSKAAAGTRADELRHAPTASPTPPGARSRRTPAACGAASTSRPA